MSGPKDPLDFCADYPSFTVGGDASLHLPLNLPPVTFDGTCEGFNETMATLNAQLSFLFPIIRIVECVLKVIDAVKAIPDSLGPPPDPTIIVERIADLVDCIGVFLQFTGYGAIPDFCKFFRDLMRFIITALDCLITMLTISIESGEEVNVLKESLDPDLVKMGNCLEAQNELLSAQINARFSGMKVIILLLNALLGALPEPLKAEKIEIDGGSIDISPAGLLALQDVIVVLEAAEAVFDACALGT
jgi:hypothetical protein